MPDLLLPLVDNFVGAELPIAVTADYLDGSDVPLHAHESAELIIVLHGQGLLTTEQGEYALVSGDVFVFREQQLHGFRQPTALEAFFVTFQPSVLSAADAYLDGLPGYHLLFAQEPAFRRQHNLTNHLQLRGAHFSVTEMMLRHMKSEYEQRPPGYAAMLLGQFIQLVVLLSRQYVQTSGQSARRLRQMSEIIRTLELRHSEPVTLAELAEVINCSVNTLLRLFKRATGMSPMDYLLRFRLHRAAAMLNNTELNVTQIAYRVGFTDSNYFSRQFKKHTGWTPLEYRGRRQAGA
jgi:AraC family L-rhamnose operon transcriptional activator RhaR/AraC family L-rhamnose operon regulatory protein RhaS